MTKVLIKMCGITKSEDAVYAKSEGADLIGMVFSKTSPRCVCIETARKIAAITDAKTVGVFYEQTSREMQEMINKVPLDYAQLHGPKAIENGNTIKVPKIYVIQPGDSIELLPNFNVDEDYVLFDSIVGGSGNVLDWTKIAIPKNVQWFIAGGLSPENVSEAIDILEPSGVDVSSGIENGIKGIKDKGLIKQFIEVVRYAEARRSV